MTSGAIDLYFRQLRRYEKAQSARDTTLMHEVVATVLDLTPKYARWRSEQDDTGNTFHYPLLDSTGFTIAAIHDDLSMIKRLREQTARYNPDIDLADFEQDVEIVRRAREMVAEAGAIEIAWMRNQFPKEQRPRLADLRYWMLAKGDFYLDVRDGLKQLLALKPVPAEGTARDKPSALGKGRAARIPSLIDISRLPEPVGVAPARHRTERHDRPFTTLSSALERELIPRLERHSRSHQTYRLKNVTWLAASTNFHADGTNLTDIEIRNHDGNVIGYSTIHNTDRLRSQPQSDTVISLSRDLDVVIFDEDASELASFGLATNPEVIHTMKGIKGLEAFTALRSIDASAEHRRVLVTVLDHAFVFDFDGNVLAAWSFPAVNEPMALVDDIETEVRMPFIDDALRELGLHPTLGLRQVANYVESQGAVKELNRSSSSLFSGARIEHSGSAIEKLRDGVGSLSKDWIYCSRFSNDGESVFLGGHSGLLMKISLSGEVKAMWWLPSAPRDLLEAGSGLWGDLGYSLFSIPLSEDPIVQHFDDSIPLLITDRLVLSRKGKEYKIVDMAAWTCTVVEAPSGITAYYEAGDSVIMETGTSKLSLTR